MPATRLRSEVIVDALRLACRAPSLHNSQPWRWVATDHTVELFADPARLVRSADATGREALISCGAVLDHFRVAMAAAGWQTSVQRFPDSGDPLHLATIAFIAATVSDEQKRRADAILLRRTDRLPLASPPGWDELARTMMQNTASGTVRVDVVGDDFRDSLAQASELVAALRAYDTDYHNELSWWTADFDSSAGYRRAHWYRRLKVTASTSDVRSLSSHTPNAVPRSTRTTRKFLPSRPTKTPATAYYAVAKCFPPFSWMLRRPACRRAR